MNKKTLKPGAGWQKLSRSVYGRSGTRIHTLGSIRLNNGRILFQHELTDLDEMININGGNRKRGLMALANNLDL